MMSLNHLVLCGPLLLLPSIFPSIRVYSNEERGRSENFLRKAASNWDLNYGSDDIFKHRQQKPCQEDRYVIRPERGKVWHIWGPGDSVTAEAACARERGLGLNANSKPVQRGPETVQREAVPKSFNHSVSQRTRGTQPLRQHSSNRFLAQNWAVGGECCGKVGKTLVPQRILACK